MTLIPMMALGLAAGLHGALYGADKDSPHESFRIRRFAREIVISVAIAVALPHVHSASTHQTAFVLYLALFALTRIATEFWKLFVRVEPQEDFRIPTQIHCVTDVVRQPALRLLLRIGFLASIYGVWALCTLIPATVPAPQRGLVVGLVIGLAEALAGAYKDGTIEGFHWRKFVKSPIFGSIGGVVASEHTTDLTFLLLAAIGTMRMFLELLFKMLPRDYAPGKLPSLVGRYQEWTERRRHFIAPYALTWLLYLVLCSHRGW
jgi:hypothetical protein